MSRRLAPTYRVRMEDTQHAKHLNKKERIYRPRVKLRKNGKAWRSSGSFHKQATRVRLCLVTVEVHSQSHEFQAKLILPAVSVPASTKEPDICASHHFQ